MSSKKIFVKQLLFTIAMIFVYRLGQHIIVPGLSFNDILWSFKESGVDISENNNIASIIRSFSIFQNGLHSYFLGTGLMLILCFFIPGLRKKLYGDNNEMQFLERLVMIFTLVLALISSYSLILNYKYTVFSSSYDLVMRDYLSIIVKSCGAMVVVYLFKLITKYGIANGVFVYMVYNMILQFKYTISSNIGDKHPFYKYNFNDYVLLVFLIMLIFVFVLLFIKAKRRINLVGKNKQSDVSILIRLNSFGVLPVIYVATLVSIYKQISLMFFEGVNSQINFSYYTIVIIFLFTLLLGQLVFNPHDINNILEKYGYKLKNLKKGQNIIQYLTSLNNKFLLLGAAGLIFLQYIPHTVNNFFNTKVDLFTYFPIISFFTLTCFVITLVKRYENLKNMENSDLLNMETLQNCNTTLEADIITEILQQNGIEAYSRDTRTLPGAGTFALFENCFPRFPYLFTHRYLGSGTIQILVSEKDLIKAQDILSRFE